jgi:site-specific DNA recombinase
MRAIGYFRETRKASLAEQSEAFLGFCSKNGYEAAATFLDAAGDESMSGFHHMVEFIRQQTGHGFLMVVVPSVAILGASPIEVARRCFQLSSLGVPVLSVDSGEEVSAEIVEVWPQLRANGSLGDRVKTAMRRKAVKGEALGRPPYGYKVGANRRFVIVAEEGSVVRYIFKLYLKDGLGIRRISRRLNEDNIKTRRGGLWSMVTVRDILRNRVYVGTYSRFGVRVPASHAPLISQEDFQRVQERLDQRRPSAAERKVSPFLLSGLIYCGYCGNKMIGVTRKQKWQRGDGSVKSAQYRYYQCESRTNRSLCDYHTKRAEVLEERVRSSLSSATADIGSNGFSRGGTPELQMQRLRDKIRRLDKRLEQYMDAAAQGGYASDRLHVTANQIATEQLDLEDRLMEAGQQAQKAASQEERRRQVERTLGRLRGEWESLEFSEKRDLLRDVIDRIVVKDDDVSLSVSS